MSIITILTTIILQSLRDLLKRRVVKVAAMLFISVLVLWMCSTEVNNKWSWTRLLRSPYPSRNDLPLIQDFVAQMPNVRIKTVWDGSSFEDQEVYLVLATNNGQEIVLQNPTISSFTGDGGDILLFQIEDCSTYPIVSMSSSMIKTEFPDLYVTSVSELIKNYPAILTSLRNNMGNAISKRKPGCLPLSAPTWPANEP